MFLYIGPGLGIGGSFFYFFAWVIRIAFIYGIYRLYKFIKTNKKSNDGEENQSFTSEEKNSIAYLKWVIANAGAKFLTAIIWGIINLVIGVICSLITMTSSDIEVVQGASVVIGISSLIFGTLAFLGIWNGAKLMRNI